ncbi:hypothetical protein SNEBB_001577 [Seison nebaliae]|nr:hypothetical protein SNEBB_001577 [Seison nebaliae]
MEHVTDKHQHSSTYPTDVTSTLFLANGNLLAAIRSTSTTKKKKKKNVDYKKITCSIPSDVMKIINRPINTYCILAKHMWNYRNFSQFYPSANDVFCACHTSNNLDYLFGKKAFPLHEKGVHVWAFIWCSCQRGTDASVGICTNKNDNENTTNYMNKVDWWRWNLSQGSFLHNRKRFTNYPKSLSVETMYVLSDAFLMILNLNENYLAFLDQGQFVGKIKLDLDCLDTQTELCPVVTTSDENSQVTMYYVGSSQPDNEIVSNTRKTNERSKSSRRKHTRKCLGNTVNHQICQNSSSCGFTNLISVNSSRLCSHRLYCEGQ